MNVRTPLTALAAALLTLTGLGPVQAVGPTLPHDTILNGQYTLIPLKDRAMLSRTKHGYRFRAGQQDSHLVIRTVRDGLRFHDSGTRRWRSLADGCRKARARTGVAAVCAVPRTLSARRPMLIEVWPRLGDDVVDGSMLPRAFQMAVLADAGRDVVRTGAGHDFVNGAFGADRVHGGGGADWIRTGPGDDVVRGGGGGDRLVGSEGADVVRGGRGADSVEGSAGNDRLSGGAGRDRIRCGGGRDLATAERGERTGACERVLWR